MAVTTLAEALAQYTANSNWYGSATKAGLFLEAAEWLRVSRPITTSDGSASVTNERLDTEIIEVRSYLRATNANRASFTTARGIID